MAQTTRVLAASFPISMLARVVDAVPGVELIEVPDTPDLPPAVYGEVLLTPPWDSGNLRAVLDRGVRWIHTVGTGLDRFPFAVVGDRLVTCSRGASGIPIAEWVLAMMLAFEKRLPEAWVTQPPERWHEAQLGGLYGKTCGVVGLGGIGTAVARRALAFDMRVRALRRSGTPSPFAGIECVRSLVEVLGSADHLVLALPLTAETHHLIGHEALAQVKPGLHLINVARGALVDQEALRAALDDGRVARASLDVVEPEPLPAGHWLYAHPRVRLSPHISWSMPAAFDLLLDTFIDNLQRYRAREPLHGQVDRTQGY
ncbi:MAG: NAD(P)-dependent oxidoreductase [Candidatus Binatia bacterium]